MAPSETYSRRPRADFTGERMRWIVSLRWGAMVGAGAGCLVALLGLVPGVNVAVMGTTAVLGLAYNALLWRRIRRRVSVRASAALAQALGDMLALTVFLWAAGGVECPFLGFYIFHVALIAILGGPRWTALAVLAALAGASFLALPQVVPALRIGTWNPVPPWDVAAEITAYLATLVGAAYIVTHAVNELRDREKALETARDRAALDYQVLSNTLDELHAGLEIVGTDGNVIWRNKRAEELAVPEATARHWECPGEHRACERDVTGVCPVSRARGHGQPGRCRFAVASSSGDEHVYEMLVFPIDEDTDHPRVMNLYVDRTQATLAERQLLLAERLASLGRVAQGVAHELNTPLATIRTLASDIRHALEELSAESDAVDDLDESATLIHDETLRLGRITQSLLAGGDLVRARIDGSVPLAAVVERARAIVSAGVRGDVSIAVDEGLGALQVEADHDRLVQVLVNLLQNAVDAVREEGEPGTVSVRAEETAEGVVVSVHDDGPGLSEEMQSRLFEPFATTKPPGEGTGLGLYTSYMLVQAMGGALVLHNGEGGGAVAELTLPAAELDVPLARLGVSA